MPRAKVILTTDDLRAILRGELPLEKLKEWAGAELDRRVKAGSLGGRPARKDDSRVDNFDFGA